MKRVTIYIAFSLAIIVAALVTTAIPSHAQSDSPIQTISGGLPNIGYQQIYTYTSGLLTYQCFGRSTANVSTITVSAASNANPVSFTATAHGLDYQSLATITPAVYIYGATSGWTGINGQFIATPTSANAFTIPVDSTSFGTFVGQTIVVSTKALKTTDKVWAITKRVYDASNNLIWSGWAVDTTGATLDSLGGGSPSFKFACASKTTYAYQ